MDTAIYLDFDGVLFPLGRPVFDAGGRFLGPRRPIETFERFGLALREAGCDAGLIVTSSWRETHSVERLASLLRGLGITLPVRGVTPRLSAPGDHSTRRWAEISAHAERARSDGVRWARVLVFDDLPLREDCSESGWHFVQPRPGIGLRAEDLPPLGG